MKSIPTVLLASGICLACMVSGCGREPEPVPVVEQKPTTLPASVDVQPQATATTNEEPEAMPLSAQPPESNRAAVNSTADSPAAKPSTAAPDEPKGRVAELIAQLGAAPAASISAGDELGKLGPDARPACMALVQVMLRQDPEWRDARLAAAEALEKIHPKLQAPVLKIILTPESEFNPDSGPLREIASLGPEGRGALPLLQHLWSLDPDLGLHVNGTLLSTMHAVAPTEESVTEQVIGVVNGKISAGFECSVYALDILDKRGLPADEVADMYIAVFGRPEAEGACRSGSLNRLRAMAKNGQIKPEQLLKPLMDHLAGNDEQFREEALIALGELGPAAKEAIPLIRRIKFEDPDEDHRKAAAAALLALED